MGKEIGAKEEGRRKLAKGIGHPAFGFHFNNRHINQFKSGVLLVTDVNRILPYFIKVLFSLLIVCVVALQLDNVFNVTSAESGATYIVRIDSNCPDGTCGHPQSLGIPCRHVFAVQISQEIDLFKPEVIANRYNFGSCCLC